MQLVSFKPEMKLYDFLPDLSREPAWLQLHLNKTFVASLHVSGYHPSNSYMQISRTVILRSRKGDHVKVVNVKKKSGTAYRHSYSGFSGARLYRFIVKKIWHMCQMKVKKMTVKLCSECL